MEWIDAKTIVTTNKTANRDYLAAEYTMNIYRGCSHGCIYCFARSAYYNIQHFDCVRAKKDALRIIRDDLQRKVKNGVITTGGMSDPYNPEEQTHQLTRNSLELINAFSFGICILTKSSLVCRDTDILTDIQAHSPVNISFSITSATDALSQKIEPHAATTTQRFEAMAQIAKKGIITGVLLDPVIPFITDTEENIREIIKKAKQVGASYVYASMLVTMEGIQREYFFHEAEKHFPGIAAQYERRFKNAYRCRAPKAKALWTSYLDECSKQGLLSDMRAVNQLIRVGYPISGLDLRI